MRLIEILPDQGVRKPPDASELLSFFTNFPLANVIFSENSRVGHQDKLIIHYSDYKGVSGGKTPERQRGCSIFTEK